MNLTRDAVKFGPALSGDTTIGAVVDEKQYNLINEYIEIGKHERRLAYQANWIEANGCYVPPTIFADVPPDTRIARGDLRAGANHRQGREFRVGPRYRE